ncbi:MAG TPA: 3'-5' exonuclease [Firmicutes bacterium]|nr:3'-5' exonuclease [Bacillota bacterium]
MIGISGQLIFLDVETTGLSPRWDRIIEIFLVSLQKDGEVRELGTLINPERPIPARITELTGLTDRDVAQAPLESEIAAEIRDFIGFGLPVAHNLPFDRGFLNAMFRRNNLLEIGDAGLDTLAISRELFPKLCIYPGGGGSHRLSNLMYHFGLEGRYANSHRAKDDVLLLVEVFRNLQSYAAGTSPGVFPAAVTHGCPECGSAMYLCLEKGKRILRCQQGAACRLELVV